MQGKEMLHEASQEIGNLFFQNKLCELQMVQYNDTGACNPLVSFTFWGLLGVSSSLHAGNGRMLHLAFEKDNFFV